MTYGWRIAIPRAAALLGLLLAGLLVWIGARSADLEDMRRQELVDTVQSPLAIPRDETTVWLSAYHSPLLDMDGSPVSSPALGKTINAFARASDGSLWVAGDQGVLRYTRAGVVEKAPELFDWHDGLDGSRTTSSMSFSIPQMIYQTIGFRLACLGVVLVLTWFVFRYRIDQVKAVMRQRMEARHAERERIARDLHDTLLQGIQALLFRLQIWASDPRIAPDRRDEIAAVVVQARAIVVEGRDRLVTLRGTDPECQDLLESLIEVASTEFTGKAARFEIASSGMQRPLLAEACRHLVDIAREAIRNAHQHARATLVAMSVDYRNTSLRLQIVDDGCGIDPDVLKAARRCGHFGLVGMRERAAQLGARFSVERNGTSGTRVTVVAPGGVVFEDRWPWPWRRKAARAQ